MQSVVLSSGTQDMEIVRGDGCMLYGSDGSEYLDFTAGWCVGNIGWGNKAVAAALRAEAGRGVYAAPSWKNTAAEEFAQQLLAVAPGSRLTRVVRCVSGSEAVDKALQYARASTGNATVISISGVYHGHTYGAASVGDALSDPIAPGIPALEKLPMPKHSDDAEIAITALERLCREGDIAAFLTEPVWTNAGVHVPPESFLPRAQRLCREHGVLLVMDEVATGFGRCGTLFGSELWDLEPDILCLGKGITGGYGSLGAVLLSDAAAAGAEDVPGYSTFGWLGTDLAAAKANVQVILDNFLWENAAQTGAVLLEELKSLEEREDVGEVRGIGLLLGIDVVEPGSGREDREGAERIMEICRRHGLLIETAGATLFLTPPLTLSREQALRGASVIRAAFDER